MTMVNSGLKGLISNGVDLPRCVCIIFKCRQLRTTAVTCMLFSKYFIIFHYNESRDGIKQMSGFILLLTFSPQRQAVTQNTQSYRIITKIHQVASRIVAVGLPYVCDIITLVVWATIQSDTCRPIGYERVYLTLCKVADTPFHIQ